MTDNTPTARRIDGSADLDQARSRLLADLGDWIRCCIHEFSDAPPTDGHDQGTFTAAWSPYVLATGDERPVTFMKAMRDAIRRHFVDADRWRHGYWRMQEAHHGTEHFELFLGALWRLDRDDGETVRQLVDAAEHIGNWRQDVPPWFDWPAGVFLSTHFGADGVRTEPGMDLNVPDHLRCVNIALLAHAMTDQRRYLDLAVRHAGRWADAIAGADSLPLGLAADGPVRAFPPESKQAYRRFAGAAPELDDDLGRAENLLASGAVNAFLQLWQITDEARFRAAAERLLDTLAAQLHDPDAGAAADVIRTYRRATGDGRYDPAVREAVAKLDPFDVRTLTIDPAPPQHRREPGIGKRADQPDWSEDGRGRRHNPITLAVAAEIAGDAALATRAMDLARTYFLLAREVYPHGREHGCSARTVSAIARGHGRENGAGMVTAVLGALPA